MREIRSLSIVNGQDEPLNYPSGICYDPLTAIFYVAEMYQHWVSWFNPRTNEKGTLPNRIRNFNEEEYLSRPLALSVIPGKTLFACDAGHNSIFSMTFGEDEWLPVIPAPGKSAKKNEASPEGQGLNLPGGVTVDQQGKLYTNDFLNNRICVIDKAGEIKALIGGDRKKNFLKSDVEINKPYGIFYFKEKVYFTDTGNRLIRYIDLEKQQLITLEPEEHGCSLSSPIGITVDPLGNIYLCEQRRMLFIDAETNVLHEILNRDIWKEAALEKGIEKRLCHIGAAVVPAPGEIYWVDTIKGIVYCMVISL